MEGSPKSRLVVSQLEINRAGQTAPRLVSVSAVVKHPFLVPHSFRFAQSADSWRLPSFSHSFLLECGSCLLAQFPDFFSSFPFFWPFSFFSSLLQMNGVQNTKYYADSNFHLMHSQRVLGTVKLTRDDSDVQYTTSELVVKQLT